jgi:hypothetical protein
MRKLFLLIIATSILTSCQKDNSPKIQTNYLPLEIGNYWIYHYFEIDTLGNETAMSMIDSVVISRDTIINHKKYYVFEGTNYPFTYSGYWGIVDILRDSSGYIVNQKGIVQFAENDFTDTIAYYVSVYNDDTLFTIAYQMEEVGNTLTVPAGTFKVLDYKGAVVTSINTPGIIYPRYTNIYYAEGVGRIMQTYFYLAGPKNYEKRLIRYHIQE